MSPVLFIKDTNRKGAHFAVNTHYFFPSGKAGGPTEASREISCYLSKLYQKKVQFSVNKCRVTHRREHTKNMTTVLYSNT